MPCGSQGSSPAPREPSGLGSAFLSELFHAIAAGQAITLPVGPDATSCLMSVERVVDNLVRAAAISEGELGLRQAWALPALRLRMADLADGIALARSKPNLVAYEPDERIEALFGRHPPLSARMADTLELHHDETAERLIQRTLATLSGWRPYHCAARPIDQDCRNHRKIRSESGGGLGSEAEASRNALLAWFAISPR